MPIYEYRCEDCGHELEALQKMSDVPLSDCPSCKRPGLKKRISAPGFRLSGSGWYETDFKSDRQKNLAKSDSADKDKSAKPDKPAAGKADGESKSAGKSSSASSEAAA